MKTLKNIRESNVSAGFGVRGFGDMSGTPATTDDVENSHIERVTQGAIEYSQAVKDYINNTTNGIYTFDDTNWWAKPGSVKSITLLGTPKTKTKTTTKLSEEMTTGGVAGIGSPPPEGKPSNWSEPGVLPIERKKHKRSARQTFYMLRRNRINNDRIL